MSSQLTHTRSIHVRTKIDSESGKIIRSSIRFHPTVTGTVSACKTDPRALVCVYLPTVYAPIAAAPPASC